jgi:uncharacterized protein YdcH (DUF465 family)
MSESHEPTNSQRFRALQDKHPQLRDLDRNIEQICLDMGDYFLLLDKLEAKSKRGANIDALFNQIEALVDKIASAECGTVTARACKVAVMLTHMGQHVSFSSQIHRQIRSTLLSLCYTSTTAE